MSRALIKTGFPDLPIDPRRGDGSDNQDLLGLDSHADALASFVEMCSTPMTIGLQGDWGSGKTSLMNLIRAKLGEERALNIWFNTWQYSQFNNEDRLASSMLINLMHKVKSEGKPSKKVWHNASRFVRAVVQATSVGNNSGVSVQGRSLLDALDGKGEVDEAGLFEQMKDDFSEVINDILDGDGEAKFERVVIYIDDLDRLAPSKAVELLEAVKNLIDVAGCVFVLAIDYDVVIRGLRQKKGYDSEGSRENEGKSFFDKIIQVPYRMPVERYRTQGFLRDHFVRVYGELSEQASSFFDESAADLIRLSVGNNPRGLKRALNIHSLFSHLMRVGREQEAGDDERIVTLVLACIQVAMPTMYSVISKYENPFRTLVSLQDPGVYGLIGADDQASEFSEVAARLDQSIGELQEVDDDDDDDDDHHQRVAELRLLVADLRRFVSADEIAKQKRMQGLAQVALQAIDLNGDGVYSPHELEILDTALSVAKATSVDVEEIEEIEEPAAAPTRRHVGFKELSQSLPCFASHPQLIFWDFSEGEFGSDFRRMPDYGRDIAKLYVIVDGAAVGLKHETMRVLEQREARGGRTMTSKERAGQLGGANYWVVEGDEQERTVAMLRDEWKQIWSHGVDTRSQAGRDAYDTRVLTYLRGRAREFVAAREVMESVGGSTTQMRGALNRLIEQGDVTYKGKARGTRYRLA